MEFNNCYHHSEWQVRKLKNHLQQSGGHLHGQDQDSGRLPSMSGALVVRSASKVLGLQRIRGAKESILYCSSKVGCHSCVRMPTMHLSIETTKSRKRSLFQWHTHRPLYDRKKKRLLRTCLLKRESLPSATVSIFNF